ncbi:conserved hypothetical protein [Microsporum canis CBS 113480]|uniref:Uncharacterized protein n=1 Tax=Arthroderma otae (strain ATCC MYA-4605 / CBS 113480) TaxID=554155 RepID=C5FVC0_ARTOC|nr:conserved hypothetical protein [Microsporum canis CBS 113480]EEQ33854.1 conserved hypothetical protein [Microsporum canis CBS 113480]
MTATLSGAYTSAPDTPSPIFPERLIRPLPKRPLRSRLSSDAADTILYPPSQPTTQLFYGAYSTTGDSLNDAKVYVQGNVYGYEHSADGESGEDDGPVAVRRGFLRAIAASAADSTKVTSNGTQDGYDAFENTNNKKKRKIPTSGGLGCHSSLSSDIASLSCSGGSGASADDGSGQSSYYGSGNPVSPVGTSGISGKGRYSRNGPGRGATARTPLAAHSPNTWSTGRRHDSALAQENFGKDKGIISAAIANAAAALSSSPQGQKNISLLDQTKRSAPAKTQFTFTCESDSSRGMAWQSAHPYSLPDHHRSVTQPPLPGQRGFSTQGTQTSPNMATQANHHHHQQARQQSQQQQHQQQQPGQAPTPAPPPRKPRRSARAIYAHAARQRRIQQQYTNLHHPPDLESIWICEFCEYESIFGHPPEALIRQYEIKDRKERRRLAEKRRLLEKAKMKSRKGKKGHKNTAKQQNAAAVHGQGQNHVDRVPSHPNDQNLPPDHDNGEEYDEDYEDDGHDDIHADAAPRIPPSIPKHHHPPSPPNSMQDGTGGQSGKASASASAGGGGPGRAG